tara:strand:- start:44 stop:481 length:438 start_codon:yes stop_codon:yes gene_type:complete
MVAGSAACTGNVAPGGAGGGFPNAMGTAGENCGSYYYFSGGGAGGGNAGSASGGGLGGGGDTGTMPGPEPGRVGSAGTVNTGGGGGGPNNATNATGGAGGSGIVVLRFPSGASVTVSPGTNTVTCAPDGNKLATFTVSGTNTVTV